MNFRRISDAELADFAQNVANVLAGGGLAALDPVVRAELVAALGSLPDTLAEEARRAMASKEASMSDVSIRNQTGDTVRAMLARVRNSLKASVAPNDQYALCGFDQPRKAVRIYMAGDPTDLSAECFSNGENRLRFVGNSRYGNVIYQIWRRDSKQGEWLMHATVQKQSFIDDPVKVGKYYEYKIRAVAARSVSNFSNVAMVWGNVGKDEG